MPWYSQQNGTDLNGYRIRSGNISLIRKYYKNIIMKQLFPQPHVITLSSVRTAAAWPSLKALSLQRIRQLVWCPRECRRCRRFCPHAQAASHCCRCVWSPRQLFWWRRGKTCTSLTQELSCRWLLNGCLERRSCLSF